MFREVWSNTLRYLWPPKLLAGLSFILSEWHRSDIKEKTLLLILFAPMLFCILGLLYSVASFVLFILPSFILSVLGWGLLIALFGGGGLFFFEKMQGKRASQDSHYTSSTTYDFSTDENSTDAGEAASNSPPKASWFKNVKWPR